MAQTQATQQAQRQADMDDGTGTGALATPVQPQVDYYANYDMEGI